MYEELKSVQLDEVSNEELRKIVNNIRKFFINNGEEYKTNESAIGFRYFLEALSLNHRVESILIWLGMHIAI